MNPEPLYFTALPETLQHMVIKSGMTAAEISRSLGRTSGYLATMLNDKRTPRLDLFVSIAQACGYTVQMHGHGETFFLADREFMGSNADAYPDSRVFAITNRDVEPTEPFGAPEEPPAISREPIDWSSIPEETEEEFAQRDPLGYAEYRKEMDQLAEEAIRLEERIGNLRRQVMESMISGLQDS